MSYLSVITLNDAKNYLRIDDDLTEDDLRISSMIKASLSTIEKRTNILLYARNKEYLFQDYCVHVYDHPINEVISPSDLKEEINELYSVFNTNSSKDIKLTLNVGFIDPVDLPSELIECALEYVKYMYYDSESNTNKSNNIPMYIDNIINQNKRFII